MNEQRKPRFDRGRRLGSELMGRLLHHPGLANIERILLDTRDAMPFYRRFGFQDLMRSDRNGGSTLMIGGAGVGRRLPMI